MICLTRYQEGKGGCANTLTVSKTRDDEKCSQGNGHNSYNVLLQGFPDNITVRSIPSEHFKATGDTRHPSR